MDIVDLYQHDLVAGSRGRDYVAGTMGARNLVFFVAAVLAVSAALRWFEHDLISQIGASGLFVLLAMFLVSAINVRLRLTGGWSMQALPKGAMAGAFIAALLTGGEVVRELGAMEAAVLLAAMFASLFAWSYRIQRRAVGSGDPLGVVLAALLPARMVDVVRAEGRILATALFIWRRRKTGPDAARFTSHNVMGPALLALAFLAFVEGIAIDLAIRNPFPAVALVSTCLHIFLIAYLVGLAKGLYFFPTVVDDGAVDLRFGLMQHERIGLSEISGVSPGWPADRTRENSLDMAFMGAPNCIIELRNARPLKGVFGAERSARYIGFYFDRPADFRAEVLRRGGSGECNADGPLPRQDDTADGPMLPGGAVHTIQFPR